MSEGVRYQPKNPLVSPRFCGVTTFIRLPNVQTTEDVDYIVAGVPFDTGSAYRVGSRFGPAAMRSISIIIKPFNTGQGIDPFTVVSGVDYGDFTVVPGFIEDTYERVAAALTPIMKKGVVPILLGGDHSVSLGHLRAAARAHGPVALVLLDSHVDTYDDYYGHKYTNGTPFRRAVEEGLIDTAHSIMVGIRGSLFTGADLDLARDLGFAIITGDELLATSLAATAQRIHERVGPTPTFVSFDIDFVDAAYTPGANIPEFGGPTVYQAMQLVRMLKGLNFVGFDVVEIYPAHDHGEITALAGAQMAYEFITLIALQKLARMQAVTAPRAAPEA